MKPPILIIDDSQATLSFLKNTLEKEFTVFSLSDPKDAVDTALAIEPSLIMLDVIISGLSGFDIIKKIKQDDKIKDIPVIFLTDQNKSEDEERGFSAGAVDYIIKPSGASTIRARVRAHVNLYQARQLIEKEQAYNEILLGLSDDVYWMDYEIATDTMTYSKNYAVLFNVPRNIKNFTKVFTGYSVVPPQSEELFFSMIEDIKQGIEKPPIELEVAKSSEKLFWHSIRYKILWDKAQKPIRAVGRIIDITEQKEHLFAVEKRAQSDPLTNLYNKEESRFRIERTLSESTTEDFHAFIIFDIDNFKGVNDCYGHHFGDIVLKSIADTMRNVFRTSDILGRLGGDEFCVMMVNCQKEEIVVQKLKQLTSKLYKLFDNHETGYICKVSTGVSFYPSHGETFCDLYKNGDFALYAAKNAGRDQYKIFSSKPE